MGTSLDYYGNSELHRFRMWFCASFLYRCFL
uniref:Uncharacterized protein n=1 Tax=Arundo donax TaxID=35708 RepID=A0A0A8Z322_ARUDO